MQFWRGIQSSFNGPRLTCNQTSLKPVGRCVCTHIELESIWLFIGHRQSRSIYWMQKVMSFGQYSIEVIVLWETSKLSDAKKITLFALAIGRCVSTQLFFFMQSILLEIDSSPVCGRPPAGKSPVHLQYPLSNIYSFTQYYQHLMCLSVGAQGNFI